MLIIANGAFKSGSTWQYRILKELTGFEDIPEAYQAGWINPSIDMNTIERFLNEVDITSNNYLAKNHIESIMMRDMVLKNEHVRIFNIERDIRDVLVSAYHHKMRTHDIELSFADYMAEDGFQIARHVLSYHRMWNAPQSRRYFIGSYEALHHDFENEVRAMADFLNIAVSDEQLQSIHEKTSIQQLRVAYNEDDKSTNDRFFRKGEIGDWVNYFDESLLEQLQRVQDNFNKTPSLLSHLKSTVKQWFQK